MSEKFMKSLLAIVAIIIIIYTISPILVIVISAFNASMFFEFPPTGFTLRWFIRFFEVQEYQRSIMTSVRLALSAIAISLAAGIPAAFALDRHKFPGNNFLQGLFLSPLLLPQIIWSIGLIQFYAIVRFAGGNLLNTFTGLVLAHAVITLPYVIRMVLSSLKFVDIDLENAAQSLGASPIRTFFEVTIPLIMPGVIVSAVFGFMVSFTDVVVATFVAGARNITFPVRVYTEMRTEGLDPLAVAVSALIVTFIVVLALIGEKTIRWSRFI